MWSDWQEIAFKTNTYLQKLDYEGPACYQLGIRTPEEQENVIVYVGETDNEKERISNHATLNTHLKDKIEEILHDFKFLSFRSLQTTTKEEAKAEQDRWLARYSFDWNDQGN